jgi:ketosteroid isomerase-like protein
MVSVRETLERGDFDEVVAALSPDVVWVGLEPGQLCRSRDEVVLVFRRAVDSGMTGTLEVVAEHDDMLVVVPHVQPPPEDKPELHQVFVVRDGQITELRDFRDRAGALAAVGVT